MFRWKCLFVLVYNKVEYRTPHCHCNTSFPCYTGKRSTLITSGFGERELQEPTETLVRVQFCALAMQQNIKDSRVMCVSVALINSYSKTHWVSFSVVIWQTGTSPLLRIQRIITLNVSLIRLESNLCRVFTVIPSVSRPSSLSFSHTF